MPSNKVKDASDKLITEKGPPADKPAEGDVKRDNPEGLTITKEDEEALGSAIVSPASGTFMEGVNDTISYLEKSGTGKNKIALLSSIKDQEEGSYLLGVASCISELKANKLNVTSNKACKFLESVQ